MLARVSVIVEDVLDVFAQPGFPAGLRDELSAAVPRSLMYIRKLLASQGHRRISIAWEYWWLCNTIWINGCKASDGCVNWTNPYDDFAPRHDRAPFSDRFARVLKMYTDKHAAKAKAAPQSDTPKPQQQSPDAGTPPHANQPAAAPEPQQGTTGKPKSKEPVAAPPNLTAPEMPPPQAPIAQTPRRGQLVVPKARIESHNISVDDRLWAWNTYVGMAELPAGASYPFEIPIPHEHDAFADLGRLGYLQDTENLLPRGTKLTWYEDARKVSLGKFKSKTLVVGSHVKKADVFGESHASSLLAAWHDVLRWYAQLTDPNVASQQLHEFLTSKRRDRIDAEVEGIRRVHDAMHGVHLQEEQKTPQASEAASATELLHQEIREELRAAIGRRLAQIPNRDHHYQGVDAAIAEVTTQRFDETFNYLFEAARLWEAYREAHQANTFLHARKAIAWLYQRQRFDMTEPKIVLGQAGALS